MGGRFELNVFVFHFKLCSEEQKKKKKREKRNFGCIPSKKVAEKQKGLSEILNLVPSRQLQCEPIQLETPCSSLEPAGPDELGGAISSHYKQKKPCPDPRQKIPGPTVRGEAMGIVRYWERAGTVTLENGLYTFKARQEDQEVAAGLNSKHFHPLAGAKYWLPPQLNLPFLGIPLAYRTPFSIILLSIILNQLGPSPLLHCLDRCSRT